MTSQMTIGKKLTICLTAMLVLLLGLSWSSLSSLSGMKEKFDSVTESTVTKLVLADRIAFQSSRLLSAERNMVMASYAKDASAAEESRTRVRQYLGNVSAAVSEMEPLIVTPEARAILDKVKSSMVEWSAARSEIESFCAAGTPDEAYKIEVARVWPLYQTLQAQLVTLVTRQHERLSRDKQAANEDTSQSRLITISLLLLALGLGGGVLWIVRSINRSLRKIAGTMWDGAEQVAGGAKQVAGTAQGLAKGASEQAASLEETSATTEEISTTTRRNADNSAAMADILVGSAKLIGDANTRLDEMVGSMHEIAGSSDKISKIIKVIDEIAFQTNILALNAAVEAARAGEAGMGFAVVADEVRNLAQRCSQAAKDTASLIEESIAKTAEGGARLDKVAEAVKAVTVDSAKVKSLVDEVNVGNQEQARGIEQVAKTVSSMEHVTQQTAASAEEGAAASEQLGAQSESMKRTVEELRAMVGGGETVAHQPVRSREVTVKPASKQSLAAPKHSPQASRRQAPVTVSVRPVKPAKPVPQVNLANLKQAVNHPTVKPEPAPDLSPAGGPDRSSFPLDEDFSEF